MRTANLFKVTSCIVAAAGLVAANLISASTAFADRASRSMGPQAVGAPSGSVKLTQGRGSYPGRGDGGGGGGRGGPRFGGGLSIVIPFPGGGGGSGDDRPPKRNADDDDKRPRKPKKKSTGKSGGSPPTITARPQLRPQGTPPAPIGPLVGDRRDREILVTLADATSDSAVSALGRAYRLSRQSNFQSATLGVRLARFQISDRRSVDEVMTQLARDVRVLAVQPVYVYLFSQGAAASVITAPPQYAADKVHLAEAHRLARGRNVPIVIIDTGVDATHPELKGATIQSFDAVGSGKVAGETHGTAIVGIVGARAQLTGVAPDARIVAVRAFAQSASGRIEGTTETLIKGIDMGLKNGGRLFNLSFTGPRDPSVEQIIRIAESKGAVFVAAAGNGGPAAPAAFPAAYDTVLAVTAIDSGDKLYDRANRGSYIAVAAPGVDILAPTPKRGYELSSGTSLAAAHVSGIVALLLERKPDLRLADIRRLLAGSARGEQGWAQQDFGAGVVDAARALEALN